MTPLRRRRADVLVVEDNPGDVYLLQRAFSSSRMTFNLCLVSDGEEAMAFLRREWPHSAAPRPDLVLLDLNLPKKSGREVLSELRADPLLRSLPVVVLTGSQADDDIADSYRLGANVYMTKTSNPDTLTHLVEVLEDLWFVLGRLPPK